MAFELDPCRVYTETGELVADGFVRESWAGGLLVEAEHFTAHWLTPGDPVEVLVKSAVRGECTYDALVTSSELRRIGLEQVRLREAVQKRGAVRVAVTLPFRATDVESEVDGEHVVRAEPLDVVVQDVSATGMRVVCDDELPAGTLLSVDFEAEGVRLPVRLQVVRSTEQGAAFSHGCLLVGLDDRGTDQLFSFVLAEQRRQLAQRSAAR